jgi:proline iminopeptidase
LLAALLGVVAGLGALTGSPGLEGASMLFRLTTKEKLGVYALLLPPRPMLAYTLLQVNPEAAHAFAGDKEMDARFDLVYNRTSRSAT